MEQILGQGIADDVMSSPKDKGREISEISATDLPYLSV